MARFLYHCRLCFLRRNSWGRLAFFFFSGLISGGLLYIQPNPYTVSLMGRLADASVSIVGLVSVLILPFLFSAFAVMVGCPRLLLSIAFIKGFCFSFSALGILNAWGNGGWLALPLYMFSDLFSIPVLWLYWLRHLGGKQPQDSHGKYFLCLTLIGSVDYFIVSPFAASL